MKLLLFTQIVDRKDPALGFAHGWIEEFAKHCESIHVVCLKEGTHTLPSHVQVHSLGKEKKQSRVQYLIRFYVYIWKYRHAYDTVFVHMNPEYVVLGGVLWRLWGKRIGLWYTHRSVYWALRIATVLMHQAFTGSKESYQIPSTKVLVTGQGVDTSVFIPGLRTTSRPLTLVIVGRIAPIKNLELAIDTLEEVLKTIPDARLSIVGAPVQPEDFIYQEKILADITARGLAPQVDFLGGKDSAGVRAVLQSSDIFLHTSKTNSADKTIVEAMACGLYVLSSSPVYVKDIPPSCAQPLLATAYATEIVRYMHLSEEERNILTDTLRESAIREHSLARLIALIVTTLRGKA